MELSVVESDIIRDLKKIEFTICYATIDMLQKKKTNALKNVMMLITTKTHNERGVYLHEYYSTGSKVSSTDSKIFAKARSNGSKHKV